MYFKDIKIGMPVTVDNIFFGIVSNIYTDTIMAPATIIEVITSSGLEMCFFASSLSKYRR